MILNCSNLSKSYGDRLLFEGGTFAVEKGDVMGIIGANGVGKTTLFRILTGAETPDDGTVALQAHTVIGYLEQHVCADSERTAYEETLTVFDPLKEIEAELKELRARLAESPNPDPALIERQEQLLETYHEKDGLTYLSLCRSVLTGLGFTEEEQALPVSSLSGGQKSKIGLAKLLLQKPDLMLLDEPTNHLDMTSVSWLEKYITGAHITTLVISHDRYFLDKICNKVAEITTHKIYVTNGNYTRHMALKEERDKAASRHYDNVMAEVKRLEGVIEQQHRWNREKNIKTAESKEKQIARMTKNLEKPEQEDFDFSFAFRPALLSGEDVLTVKDLSMTFEGGKTLYSHVNFELKRGNRFFIIGDNGIGKTTLIKQIMRGGRSVRFGAGVTLGYFDQHQFNLSPSGTPFQEIRDAYPKLTDTEVRSSLAVFGLKGDKVFERTSSLSGGERAKVSLCKLMLKQCNLLLLDEPTNHLDIYSLAALEQALQQYDGTLLVISHDRYFMNQLADGILLLKDGSLQQYAGNYDDALAAMERQASAGNAEAAQAPAKKTPGSGGQSYLEAKKARSELTKARTALRRKEEEVDRLEQKIAALEEEMNRPEVAADYEQAVALTEELASCNERLQHVLMEWESLAETVSTLES